MEEFNIDNFKINKNYAIEASAGTGKTFSIKRIVSKILEIKREELINNNVSKERIALELNTLLNKILLVTYTEKATGELKDRIRDELKHSFKDITFDYDNLAIYTIHSFCNNTIKEFNLELKEPLKLDNIDEEDISSFIEKYARDNKELNKYIRKYDSKCLNDVIDLLISSIKNYYLDYEYKEDKDIISISDMYYLTSDEFIKKNPQVMEALDNIKDILLAEVLSDDERNNIEGFITCVEDAIEKIDEINIFTFSGYKSNNKGIKKIADDFNVIKSATNLNNTPAKYIASKFLPKVYKEWIIYKKKNKYQTFDDMIRTVREALKTNKVFLEKLRNKYIYGIIDEFQDTNQKQWDIFKALFYDNDHLIVVGDPKQSIYSFQGADINVYLKAVKEIEDRGEKLNLTRNWRSTDDMIEACNKIFNSNDPKEFFYKAGITFNESRSPKDALKKDNPKEGLYDGKKYKPVWIINDVDKNSFAENAIKKLIELTSIRDGKTRLQIKREIKTKDLDGNIISEYKYTNVKYSDISILYRTRNEADDIEYYLKRYGIPYTKYKDKGLFTSLECFHWISLLEAIYTDDLYGKNIKVFKKALFTRFFDKSITEINYEKYNKESEEMNYINKWKEEARNKLWEDLIDDILIDSNMIDRMKKSTKLDTFSKFKQIGDFLINYLSNNHTLLEAIDYLKAKSKRLDAESDEEDLDIVAKGTGFNAVQMMTIHASKGLEFPVVISSTGFKGPNNKALNYIYKDDKNNKILSFDNSDNYKDEQISEWMRLFYVDFTRASYLLIIPNMKVDNYKDGNDWLFNEINKFINNPLNEAYYEIINKNIEVSLDDVKKTLQFFNQDDKKIEVDELLIKKNLDNTIANIKNSSSYKHSYSSLSHSHDNELLVDDDINYDKEGEAIETLENYDTKSIRIDMDYDNDKYNQISSSFPKGAVIGTTLHEIFEKYDFTNTSDSDLKKLVEECYRNNGVEINDIWINDSISIARNVLNAKFNKIIGNKKSDELISLSNIDLSDKLAEVEFNYNYKDEIFKNYFNGFIDLVFRIGDIYSVIDWKSDSLNDNEFDSYANYESLKAHVDKLYSIQRVLYAHILIDWLSKRMNISCEDVFNKHFGGVYYVFIKGCYKGTPNGIYAHTWESYKDLDKAYNEVTSRIWRKK